MIEIKYQGKLLDPEKFIIEGVKGIISEKAGDLLCPDCKELAIITIKVESVENYNVHIHTCCDKFNAVISKRIKG